MQINRCNMKIKTFPLALLSLALGGTALSHTAAAAGTPLKIGVSFQEMNNPYFVTMKDALQEAAATIGANVIISDAHHDVSKQVSDIEDMIQQGAQIIIINPTDTVGVTSVVKTVHDKNIPIVSVDAQAGGPLDAFVGSKNYDAGFKACEYLATTIKTGNIGIIDGIPVVPILERVKGCKDAIAKHSDIKIVSVQNGKQERDQALTVAENMLQANPDLKGIFSVNDNGSLGVLSAIESNGSDVKLVSVDGNPEAVKAISKPGSHFIATAAQFPRQEIRLALALALAKKWGAEVPKVLPVDVELIDATKAKTFSW